MKLTVKQLVQGSVALDKLGSKAVKIIGQKNLYNVVKNIATTQPDLIAYEKVRMSLMEEYSTENGIPINKVQEFNAKIEEVQARELDLVIHVIELDDGMIERAELTANDLYLL